MTFKPYRREVVDAVEMALAEGVTVIAISDSRASPILARASHAFVVPMENAAVFYLHRGAVSLF